ncbi:phage N-6-adenine-methyltransferase [Salmonella enterica subsp. enterica serovar Paratyphi C str. CFSAN000605]|nr:phage N-6-adenine-methyltransferase [Salmonella enterica subsp. enterica serovar Paratyphi C str. CFSAN000605]
MSNKYCQALAELRNKSAHELKEVGDQWRTPDLLFWGINAMFGPLTLDLFADDDNAKCPVWYTADDNALVQDWAEMLESIGGAAFGNPPYSRSQYHEKQAITGMTHIMDHTMAMREKGGRYVFLIKAATSGRRAPWRTAAECIDWSIPCPSIFGRKKPLADNTLKRIARGIQRFVLDNPTPFIVKCNHTSNRSNYDCFRGQGLDEPLQTITKTHDYELVTPFIAGNGGSEYQAKPRPLDKPAHTILRQSRACLVAPVIARQFGASVGHCADEPSATITAGGGGKSQLVTAFLAKHFGGNYSGPGAAMDAPAHTVTTTDHHAVVTSHLVHLRGTCRDGLKVDQPVPTITAGGMHLGEVRAFLMKYYGNEKSGVSLSEPLGTVTTNDRFGLVTVEGCNYQIVDIGMRMLQPHELYRAQGFPDWYVIDQDFRGNRYAKDKQVARCGNAVPPPFAEALVRANLPELCVNKREQAA